MGDEGFHEIQLNGKQLVFLFMATTIVAVVIFLGGVMVGRGVRAEKAAGASAETVVPAAPADDRAAPPGATPGGGQQARADDDLSYYERLSKQTSPPETLKPPVEQAAPGAGAPPPPAAAPRAGDTPAPPAGKPVAPAGTGQTPATPAKPPAAAAQTPAAPARTPAAPVKTPAAPSPAAPAPRAGAPIAADLQEPPGSGWTAQVAALADQGEAEAIARRLKAKGYPVFVRSADGMFRVRVGKYQSRREADQVGSRLAKEEKIKPWITR